MRSSRERPGCRRSSRKRAGNALDRDGGAEVCSTRRRSPAPVRLGRPSYCHLQIDKDLDAILLEPIGDMNFMRSGMFPQILLPKLLFVQIDKAFFFTNGAISFHRFVGRIG